MRTTGGVPQPRAPLDHRRRPAVPSRDLGDYGTRVDMPPTRRRKGREPLLTAEEIRALRAKGLNHTEIAKIKGCTRQYVSKVWRESGMYERTPRQEAHDHFPLPNLPHRLSNSNFPRRLRDHGVWRATRRAPELSAEDMTRLRNFWAKLRENNLIVLYDPNIPSTPNNVPGHFALVPREPEDGDLLLRENEYTKYTEIGKRIYRLPNG